MSQEARAVCDFDGTEFSSACLSFARGQRLQVFPSTTNGGWVQGSVTPSTELGWLPASFWEAVQTCAAGTSSSSNFSASSPAIQSGGSSCSAERHAGLFPLFTATKGKGQKGKGKEEEQGQPQPAVGGKGKHQPAVGGKPGGKSQQLLQMSRGSGSPELHTNALQMRRDGTWSVREGKCISLPQLFQTMGREYNSVQLYEYWHLLRPLACKRPHAWASPWRQHASLERYKATGRYGHGK